MPEPTRTPPRRCPYWAAKLACLLLWSSLTASPSASLVAPPPPVEELLSTSTSVFTGVVIDVHWPWGTEHVTKSIVETRVPVPPWERAARLREEGVDIAFRTEVDTVESVGVACGFGFPHVTRFAVTAVWKGTAVDTIAVATRFSERIGEQWLIFTSATKPDDWPEASLLSPVLPLLERARHGSTRVRFAGHQLSLLPEPQWRDPEKSSWPLVFERLAREVESGDPAAAIVAARQLADLCERQEEAARALAVMLDRAEADSVAAAAVDALCDLREEALVFLGAALNHPRPIVRRAAIRGVRSLSWDAYPAMNILRRKLADSDPEVRTAAVEILNGFEIRAAPAYEELLAACHDSTPAVRSLSAAAIGLIGPLDERAQGALLGLLEDPQPGVRMSAGNALGFLGVDNEEVRSALKDVVHNDPHRAAREGAAIGLRRLDGRWREGESFTPRGTPARRPCDPPGLSRTWTKSKIDRR